MGCLRVGLKQTWVFLDIHVLTGLLERAQLGKSHWFWMTGGFDVLGIGHVSWPFSVGANYMEVPWRRTEQETNQTSLRILTKQSHLGHAVWVQVKYNNGPCMTMHPVLKRWTSINCKPPFLDGRTKVFPGLQAFRRTKSIISPKQRAGQLLVRYELAGAKPSRIMPWKYARVYV